MPTLTLDTEQRGRLRALERIARKYARIRQTAATVQRLQRTAVGLAPDGDVLSAFKAVLRDTGFVGPTGAAELLYLAMTSRLFERPVSIVLKARSSSGKSFVVERLLNFFPREAWHGLSSMSPRALAYDETSLKHRMLVIAEAAGVSDETASYLLRTLLSEQRIQYDVVVGGRLMRIERKGPTGAIVTTTELKLHPENETRMLSVTIEESEEQTRSILKTMALGHPTTSINLKPWRQFQRLLGRLPKPRVTIPFGVILAAAVAPADVRLRRDFRTVLSLIGAHVLLHAHAREQTKDGTFIAVLEDYRVVYKLVSRIIADGIQATVSSTIRETVKAVEALSARGTPTSIANLAGLLELNKSSASRRASDAVLNGYLVKAKSKPGQQTTLSLGKPLPDNMSILPKPGVVARAWHRSLRGRGSEGRGND